ncbi:MAG: CaiB/BaiF CoA transferase family protein [Chitinophagales bacterium]
MTLPLEGIKVLDLTRAMAGPFCTQILADFGAEVIKIEEPNGGDTGRSLYPVIAGQGTSFWALNRNKRSAALDLRSDEGKDAFKSLVAVSDVVVDPFRPGSLDKLGLGYRELSRINPRVIVCSLSAFGQTGPIAKEGGHDINILSLAGALGLNGTAGEAPALPPFPIAGFSGALYAVIAILLALQARAKTGRGQHCDVSMLDGAISLMAGVLGDWAGTGGIQGQGMISGQFACYNTYRTCDDRHIAVGHIETKFWLALLEKIGCPELVNWQWDPAKQTELKAIIQEQIGKKTLEEWLEILGDIPCVNPVLDLDEVCKHPQIKDREMIYELKDFQQSGTSMYLTGIPIKLSATPGHTRFKFPGLGEHTEEVLEEARLAKRVVQLRPKQ